MKYKGLVISICLSLLLAVASPFAVYAEDDQHADVGYMAAWAFFSTYGLRTDSNDGIRLQCTQGSTNPGYCEIYSQTTNTATSAIFLFDIMKIPSGSTFKTYTAYDTSNRFRVTSEYLYLVFLSSTNFTSANITAYPQSGYTVTAERLTNNYQTVMTPDGYYLITLRIKADTVPSSGTVWTTLNLPGNANTWIVPIYKGSEGGMTDDVHRVVFGTGQTYNTSDDTTHSLLLGIGSQISGLSVQLDNNRESINSIYLRLNTTNSKLDTINDTLKNGTLESRTASSNLNDKTSELNTQINSYNQLEDGFKDNMEDSLNDIDFNSSLMNDGNLLNSMLWVKQRYDRMTRSTIFGSIIQYSLLFGLGMLIIGRDKK